LSSSRADVKIGTGKKSSKWDKKLETNTAFLLVITRKLSGKFSPLKSLDPVLVSQLKVMLLESLFENSTVHFLSIKNDSNLLSIRSGCWKRDYAWSGSKKYGPGSEKLSDAQ
jgi:hypothetical protein